MSEDRGLMRTGALRIVLLVSLGVNLFLAGSWVGSLVRPGFQPPPPGPPPRLQEMVRELNGRITPDSMAKVEALLAEADRRFRSGRADPHRLNQELRDVLGAERFDGEAFTTLVDRFLTARSENDQAIAKRIAEVVSGMPLADRKVLAEIALRPPGPPRPPGEPPHGPPPGPPR